MEGFTAQPDPPMIEYIEEDPVILEPLSPTEHAALQIRITTDSVLSLDARDYDDHRMLHDILGWRAVHVYAKRLVLSGHPEPANRILRALIACKEFQVSDSVQAFCEQFWRSTALERPATPWAKWDTEKLDKATREYDPAQLEFYDWASGSDSGSEGDGHSWRESSDIPTLTACARALCRPDPNGQLPSREALTEAVEVLDKLAEVTRESKTKEEAEAGGAKKEADAEGTKKDEIPEYVGFALALHVGDSARVKASVEWLGRPEQEVGERWDILLQCPGLWAALRSGVTIQTFSNDEAVNIANTLCEALETRAARGRQKSLAYETAAGLFARYAPAAWRALRKNLKDEVQGPEEICLPGLDDEGIAKVKDNFGGWLDPELEELSRCHDGWLGGYHYDHGGFPGLAEFEAGKFDAEFELLMGEGGEWDYDEMGFETVQREVYPGVVQDVFNLWEGQADAKVYEAWNRVGDNYRYYLVVPEVWKEMTRVWDQEVPEGQYAYASWSASLPEELQYDHSVRQWLADSVVELERCSFLGQQVE